MAAMTSPPDREERRAIPGMAEAIGGWRGMIESALPTVVFVAVVSVRHGEIRLAAIVAAASAVVLAAIRLARGRTLRYVAGGLVGVGFSAFIAARTGRAENFFLPGLLLNIAYAGAFIGSIAARRPLAGYLAALLSGRDAFGGWHRDPRARAPATWASWVLAGVFVARLVVQLPLYLTDRLVALGFAKVAMGLPLFGLGIWVAWLIMRRSPLLDGPSTGGRVAPGDET